MEAISSAEPPRGDDVAIAIFQAALSRPEGEREGFVREACEDEPELQREVMRRLRWEGRMMGFLLTPVLTRERMDRPFVPGDCILSGRYRIVRVAGEGGMSVVYEAFDEKLRRRTAVKCPRFEFRKRLTEEARKALLVHHPNVCRVFEIHTEATSTGEIDFLTMEFIEGPPLSEYLKRRPEAKAPGWLRSAEGAAVAGQICQGLAAVHAAGIVHRDLKAGNVMLDESGASRRAVLMDFGLAQDSDVFHSELRGTPSYVAPELWMGRRATVQSDIYALGVLLHEMEFGRPPFGEGVSWRERLHEAPRIAGGDGARAVLAACLHPDPRRRPQSVAEVLRMLSRRSRRVFAIAAAGLVGGLWAKEAWWPSTIVRLAVLPAQGPAEGDWSALTQGCLHDLSYRFKTLRHTRRPLAVFDVTQAAREEARGPAQAKAVLGATHAIVTQVRRQGEGWRAAVSLADTASGQLLRQWVPVRPGGSLADQWFDLQSRVVGESIEMLRLHAEPRRQELPASVYADYAQGLALVRAENQQAHLSVPYFERVMAAAPDSALGYAGLAEALTGMVYASGDDTLHARALALLEKAERLDAEMAHVQLARGRLNHFMGQFERARADFQRASELDPNDPQPLLGIGWELHYLGRNSEAEVPFRIAMERHPQYYKPYADAGIFYYELRNLPRAEQLWNQALRLHPASARTKLNLAVLYLESGRTGEAERAVEEVLGGKRSLAALELLGDIHVRQGRSNQAIAAYEEALRTGPPNYKTWAPLALVYRRLADNVNAARAFTSGLEQAEGGIAASPRDPERLAWCAYYHAALGNGARARGRIADTLAVAGSPAGRVRKRLVLAYDMLRDRESALRLLEAAPAELAREISRDSGLSPELAGDRRFQEMIRK
ncbi:MAG: tetratricopeptide repeat protein [Bryobacterales bacterium]|nr:tetratricopeptide repeat protein [Bryobacterales bacterium]